VPCENITTAAHAKFRFVLGGGVEAAVNVTKNTRLRGVNGESKSAKNIGIDECVVHDAWSKATGSQLLSVSEKVCTATCGSTCAVIRDRLLLQHVLDQKKLQILIIGSLDRPALIRGP
jgi:hypothetical protein